MSDTGYRELPELIKKNKFTKILVIFVQIFLLINVITLIIEFIRQKNVPSFCSTGCNNIFYCEFSVCHP